MKRTAEEMLDEIQEKVEIMCAKLENKIEGEPRITEKKNSHIHIMINTEEKQKLMNKAKEEGIDFSEWCRQKLKEGSQLDRIERKIDKLIKN